MTARFGSLRATIAAAAVEIACAASVLMFLAMLAAPQATLGRVLFADAIGLLVALSGLLAWLAFVPNSSTAARSALAALFAVVWIAVLLSLLR